MSDEFINIAAREWNNEGISFHQDTNTYKLVDALLSETRRVDTEIDNVDASHFIATASGKQLDKIGKLVQLNRKQGESDDKYRQRIKLQFRLGNIGTTFDEVSEFFFILLDTNENFLTFEQRFEQDSATLYVRGDSGTFDQSVLTRQEIVDFGGRVVPAGHEVKIEERGTFRLKSDGDTDDPDKGLTSDAIQTGGTLASDIL